MKNRCPGFEVLTWLTLQTKTDGKMTSDNDAVVVSMLVIVFDVE